jgi:Secretion system C-terminal sorting domain
MLMKTVYSRLALLLIYLSCMLPASHILAEGSKTVMPVAANGTGLIVSTTTTFPLGNVGSYLGAPVDDRIYFYVKDYTSEKLYYGFNWETLSPATPINTYSDVYMIVYDPTGAQVGSPILMASANGQAGWINNSNQAIIYGANIGGPSLGYTPAVFAPAMNGNYYVSFYRSEDGGNTHITGGESMLAKYFDMTVASYSTSTATYTKYTGRLHCNEWAFSVYNPLKGDIQDPLASTNANFYGYTPDSCTVKVNFPDSGYKPLSYIVAFNSFGVQNTGNWQTSRQSIVLQNLVAPYLTGGYPVFLNPPDPTIWPVSTVPKVPTLIDPVISGCPPGPYIVRFNAPQPGDYYLLFDLNGDSGYQANSADRWIELDGQAAGIIPYVWDGKDGLGNQVPANTSFPIVFYFRKGRINIPMYDDELNVNGFYVSTTSPTGLPQIQDTMYYWDDTQLYNAGADCSNNNNNYTGTGYDNSIAGVRYTPTQGRAWNGNGNLANVVPAPYVLYSGVRNDQDNTQCNDFGNARLLNTWTWGVQLTATQILTLTCISVSGTVWDDADGSAKGTFNNIRTNNEPGTNAGGHLYANLVDPVTMDVISGMPVNSDGTFTLYNCPANATGMLIYITTTAGTVGSPVPAAAIPGGWTNTSPIIRPFNSGTVPLTGQDFGIEQPPTSNSQNYTIGTPVLNSYLALDGIGTVADPGPLSGSDPEDGVLGSGKSVVITSLPTNGEQLYYNGILLTANYTITNYNPALLQMKFTTINSVVSTSFTYAYLDAASVESTPATYTINTSIALSATLSSFGGMVTDAGNVLTWTAQNETRDMTFVINRSLDGVNYNPIGQVAATGDNTTVMHSFTDNSPTPNTPNYYRLEWTDGKGDVAYSNVVTLTNSRISGVLDVSPNPFHDQVTIRASLSHEQNVVVRLLDSKGSLLRQGQFQGVAGLNNFTVDASGLPPSVYFVQIVLADKVTVRKVFCTR